MLQTDQKRILPHPVRSYATYFCHLTRCRPKLHIRSGSYTLMETVYSFKIFINSYQITWCTIPKDRNFNGFRDENVKSFLTPHSISRWKPWKCHDVRYFMEIQKRHHRITALKCTVWNQCCSYFVRQRWYYSYNCNKLHLQLIDIQTVLT
jgi:hypothetical protein